jgi:hypothetical protein
MRNHLYRLIAFVNVLNFQSFGGMAWRSHGNSNTDLVAKLKGMD